MLAKCFSPTSSLRLTLVLLTGIALVLGYTISLVSIGKDHLFDPAWVEYLIVGLAGALLGFGIYLAIMRPNQVSSRGEV